MKELSVALNFCTAIGILLCAFALMIGILVANDVLRHEYKKWRK